MVLFNRNVWVDYLRSAITVLVVAHHSSLAYTTFAWFDRDAYINSTHAIVDTKRWIGLDIFENFNDVFFMSLMFLIGGIFLTKSISKKGTYIFIKDRLYRLFIPFLFLGTLLMLVAYFPSYFTAHNKANIVEYIKDYFTTEKWPVGPPWFIWVLFLFNMIFALLHSQFNKTTNSTRKLFLYLKNRAFLLFIILLFVTWLFYVPIAYSVGAGTWIGYGPFDFQLSRIILYFGYFILGVLIGNTDFNNEIFSKDSAIVKKWWLWALLSLFTYSVLTIVPETLRQLIRDNTISEFMAWMIYYFIYSASCAISCIALITGFRRLANTERKWMNSLSKNAYLIYLVHFVFVVWIQFLLIKFNIPAFTKFLITFIVSLTFSWIISSLLRKVKIISRYL